MDTLAEPPRSIWTHPYEDPQFLQELEGHLPGGRAHDPKQTAVNENKVRREDEPPPYPGPPKKAAAAVAPAAAASSSAPKTTDSRGHAHTNSDSTKHEHKGFLDKLKDKTIGTKEEREERSRQRREAEERYNRQREELLRQRLAMMQSQGSTSTGLYSRGPYSAPNYPYGQRGMMGGGMGMGGYGGRGMGMGGGGMGMGMPLMGGLAGGTCMVDSVFSICPDTCRPQVYSWAT